MFSHTLAARVAHTNKPLSHVGVRCVVLSCSSEAPDAAEASQLSCRWDHKVQPLLGLRHLPIHLARGALIRSSTFHFPS